MRIAIIGGTGVYDLGESVAMRSDRVHGPWGSAEVLRGEHAGRELVFIPRHGARHRIPPHKVNYQANIDAAHRLECQAIVATNAVGAIRPEMQPGDIVLPDQFIDLTRGRASTFFDGRLGEVRHVDMTEPYCPVLRSKALGVLEQEGVALHPAATYVCMEGPRFETPAEIRMLAQLGGDVVGMTGLPEVVLAREVGICYLSVCTVTNFAAGILPKPLSHTEVTELMRERGAFLRAFLLRLVESLDETWECGCR